MKVIVIIWLGLLVYSVHSARILVSKPFGSKSHMNTFTSLIIALSKRGHNVTVISNYPIGKIGDNPNIREVIIDELAIDVSKYPSPFAILTNKTSPLDMALLIGKIIFSFPLSVTEVTYNHPAVQNLIQNDHFDLVIISQAFSMVSYPLVWHFKAPHIAISPNAMMPGLATIIGDSEHTEYIPFLFTSYTDRMNLKERLINTVLTGLYDLFMNRWHFTAVLDAARQVLPECPPLEEIEKNISLLFTNTHPVLNYPRTLPPDVIEIGAIQCRPARPLSKVNETLIDNLAENQPT